MRAWCCVCDEDMIDEGIAMDCDEDGTFFSCPECKVRIVVYVKEEGMK